MEDNKDRLELCRRFAFSIHHRLAISEDNNDYILTFSESKIGNDALQPQTKQLVKGSLDRLMGFLQGYNYLKSQIPF